MAESDSGAISNTGKRDKAKARRSALSMTLNAACLQVANDYSATCTPINGGGLFVRI